MSLSLTLGQGLNDKKAYQMTDSRKGWISVICSTVSPAKVYCLCTGKASKSGAQHLPRVHLLSVRNIQQPTWFSLLFHSVGAQSVVKKNWTNLTGTATTFQYPNFGNIARLLSIQNDNQLMQTANKMTLTGRLEPAVNSWPPVLQLGDPDCCIHTDLP